MISLLVIIFVLGYLGIAFEHRLQINKAAIALIICALSWTVYILNSHSDAVLDQLTKRIGEVSGILFFLMSAMTIVELIDAHDGFNMLTDKILQTDKRIFCGS